MIKVTKARKNAYRLLLIYRYIFSTLLWNIRKHCAKSLYHIIQCSDATAILLKSFVLLNIRLKNWVSSDIPSVMLLISILLVPNVFVQKLQIIIKQLYAVFHWYITYCVICFSREVKEKNSLLMFDYQLQFLI